MPDEKQSPLSDAQIRLLFLSQVERVMAARMDILALERALIDKGLLTRGDIQQALQRVSHEAGDWMTRLADAMKKETSEGVQ